MDDSGPSVIGPSDGYSLIHNYLLAQQMKHWEVDVSFALSTLRSSLSLIRMKGIGSVEIIVLTDDIAKEESETKFFSYFIMLEVHSSR